MWRGILLSLLMLGGTPALAVKISFIQMTFPTATSEDLILSEIFESLDHENFKKGRPIGSVTGRRIIGFIDAQSVEVDWEALTARLRRILVHGELFQATRYTFVPGAWLGLTFGSAVEYGERVREHATKLTDLKPGEEMPDHELQSLCDDVLWTPVRH